MSDATSNLISTLGPYAGSVAAAILAAFGIKSDHAKRIAAIEAKLVELAKAQDELEDKLLDEIRDLARESMTPDGIRALVIEALRPQMDRILEIREKMADLSGAVRNLGGR